MTKEVAHVGDGDTGLVEQAVLLAVINLGKDAYGRAILNEVQHRLKRDVSAGAVYATSSDLKARAWPARGSRQERPFEEAARRYFVVTGSGARALNNAKSALDSVWAGFVWPLKVRT